MAQQRPELTDLSQQEVVTEQMDHPVLTTSFGTVLPGKNFSPRNFHPLPPDAPAAHRRPPVVAVHRGLRDD